MKQIGSLFEKYKTTLKPPQSTVESEAIQIIVDLTKIPLKKGDVVYKKHSRTLVLNIPSILKTEIKKQKSTIIDRLSLKLGVANSPDNII